MDWIELHILDLQGRPNESMKTCMVKAAEIYKVRRGKILAEIQTSTGITNKHISDPQ